MIMIAKHKDKVDECSGKKGPKDKKCTRTGLDSYSLEELCVRTKNLIYIKPTRKINQPECHCSIVNNPVHSGQTFKENYLTTLTDKTDGNKHVLR